MSEVSTLTLTEIIRYVPTSAWAPLGVEFEHLRQTRADEVITALHLMRRDGITEPVRINAGGFREYVVDGIITLYAASLLGIRDIPVVYE